MRAMVSFNLRVLTVNFILSSDFFLFSKIVIWHFVSMTDSVSVK